MRNVAGVIHKRKEKRILLSFQLHILVFELGVSHWGLTFIAHKEMSYTVKYLRSIRTNGLYIYLAIILVRAKKLTCKQYQCQHQYIYLLLSLSIL